jgi:hypothetical protein
MSECRICKDNGKPGVIIKWDDNVKNQKTGKLIPLEADGSTYHKHYDASPSDDTTSTSKAIVAKPDTLLFAESLLEIITDYIRLKTKEQGEAAAKQQLK